MDDDNFEAFLDLSIELLSARNFLYQFLNDNSVLTVGVTRGDLNMIVAAEYDALHNGRRGGRGLELLMLALYLVNLGCLIQFLQQTFSHRALPCSGRTIEKNMWEIVASCQFLDHLKSVLMHAWTSHCIPDCDGPVFLDPQSLLSVTHIIMAVILFM